MSVGTRVSEVNKLPADETSSDQTVCNSDLIIRKLETLGHLRFLFQLSSD